MRAPVLIVAAASLAACDAPDSDRPEALFNPSGSFFDAPFPSDARRMPDAGMDWRSFPNPTGLSLLDDFLLQASERQGAGFNGPTWVRFDDPIDEDRLPTPEGSLSPNATVQLIDVTPASPDFLQRVPIRFEWFEDEGAYLPGHLLATAPVQGFPLRPRTTYALIVTTGLAAPAPAFLDALAREGGGDWATALDVLQAALPDLAVKERDLASVTTFTTGDPTEEMDRVVQALRTRVSLPPLREEVTLVEDEGPYRVYRTEYATPLWMSGDKPWANEGGAFVYSDDGQPLVQDWDPMRASVVVPAELGEAPATGWPLLVYLHGTGGDWRTFCNSTSAFEVGFWGVEDGFIGLGIDLPLHGPRGTEDTNLSLHSFNVLQPDSALHIHRQGALDMLALLDILQRQTPTFRLPDGTEVPIDPDRVVVMGHSQGGLAGALALPWVGDTARAVMLSGAGGLLAITAIERDDDYDFPTLIRTLLGFAPDEPLTELHPVLGLVQHIVEPTDPINYAPYWFYEDRGYAEAPAPVLLTGGVRDDATPARTAEALASAGRLPFAGTHFTRAPGSTLRGFDDTPLPQELNVTTFRGEPMTAAFAQFFDGTHYAVFEEADARDMTRTFLSTAINGTPVIDDAPLPDPVVE